jgi:hypothetical protein
MTSRRFSPLSLQKLSFEVLQQTICVEPLLDRARFRLIVADFTRVAEAHAVRDDQRADGRTHVAAALRGYPVV